MRQVRLMQAPNTNKLSPHTPVWEVRCCHVQPRSAQVPVRRQEVLRQQRLTLIPLPILSPSVVSLEVRCSRPARVLQTSGSPDEDSRPTQAPQVSRFPRRWSKLFHVPQIGRSLVPQVNRLPDRIGLSAQETQVHRAAP